MLSKFDISSNWNVFHRIKDGCVLTPVNASVTAKQASSMLVLLCSLGLLFTASITNTLSKSMKEQVMLLMMTVTTKLTSSVACVTGATGEGEGERERGRKMGSVS